MSMVIRRQAALAVSLLVFTASTLPASAAPRRQLTPLPRVQREHRGVFVVFRPPTAVTVRDDIHRRFGARLVERIERHRIDTVTLPGMDRYGAKLLRLCSAYLLLPEVSACEIDYALSRAAHAGTTQQKQGPPPTPAPPKLVACTLEEERGKISERTLPKGMNPSWWLDMIGSRQAKKYLDDYDKEQKEKKGEPLATSTLGVIDGGGTHSKGVESILTQVAGRGKLGKIIDLSEKAPAKKGDLPPAYTSRLIAGLKDMAAEKETPVVNISMSLGDDSEAVHEAMIALSKKTIPVIAVGNDYPYPMEVNSARAPAIRVGSVNVYGELSYFAQVDGEKDEKGEVEQIPDVVAPSDDSLIYTDPTGKQDRFGGTSGAAPPATAAVGDLLSVLPGATLAEIRKLLRKTGTLTTSGYPMLNHARLVATALKLRSAGAKGGALGKLLDDPATYDFTEKAADLKTKAFAKLPPQEILDKYKDGKLPEDVCTDYREGIALLKEASYFIELVDPDALKNAKGAEQKKLEARNDLYIDVLERLAEAFQRDGLPVQASYYRNHYDGDAFLKSLRERLTSRTTPPIFAVAAARTVGALSGANAKEFEPLLKLALRHPSSEVSAFGVFAGALHAPSEEKFKSFLIDVLDSDIPDLGGPVGFLLSWLPEKSKAFEAIEERLPGGAKATKGSSPVDALIIFTDLKTKAKRGEYAPGANALVKLLNVELKEKQLPTLQMSAALGLGRVGGPTAAKALRAAFENPKVTSPPLRAAIVKALTYDGPDHHDLIAKVFDGKEHVIVLESAVENLPRLGNKGFVEIPRAIAAAKKLEAKEGTFVRKALFATILSATLAREQEMKAIGKEVVPFLEDYIKSDDARTMPADLRQLTEEVIRTLRPAPPPAPPKSDARRLRRTWRAASVGALRYVPPWVG